MRCILIDTIYKIQEQEILPAFYVDFGDKKIPADLFENVNNVLDIAKGIKKKQWSVWFIIFFTWFDYWRISFYSISYNIDFHNIFFCFLCYIKKFGLNFLQL